jgi:large subunit ribosomal protein L10
MARADKSAAIAEIADNFRDSNVAVLTEYRGLTVTQLTQLRRALGQGTTYAVVKNTLTRIAAKEAGVEGLDDLLAGPSAIAFVTGDAVETAKGLKDFAKANPALVIKGGYMDGKVLSASEINRLADLESREVLLAKLAGAMNASLSQAVYLLAAPLSQAARLFGALQAKAATDPSVLAVVVPEAAPAAAAEEAAAEVVAEDTATEAVDTVAADVAPETTDAAASEESATEAAVAEEATDAVASEG